MCLPNRSLQSWVVVGREPHNAAQRSIKFSLTNVGVSWSPLKVSRQSAGTVSCSVTVLMDSFSISGTGRARVYAVKKAG